MHSRSMPTEPSLPSSTMYPAQIPSGIVSPIWPLAPQPLPNTGSLPQVPTFQNSIPIEPSGCAVGIGASSTGVVTTGMFNSGADSSGATVVVGDVGMEGTVVDEPRVVAVVVTGAIVSSTV